MKKETKKNFAAAAFLLAAFLLWTLAVQFIDVQPIGPRGTSVGLASLNRWVQRLSGVHLSLYILTDWLSLMPVGFMVLFALMGLTQWIRRRCLFKVDHSLLVLGVFYLILIAVYLLFETIALNYRPILLDGYLEVSYPSSTTLLVLCVMQTAVLELRTRIKNALLHRRISCILHIFSVFIVVCRLFSGVHWFSDIVGSILLSAGLVFLYRAVFRLLEAASKSVCLLHPEGD